MFFKIFILYFIYLIKLIILFYYTKDLKNHNIY